MVIKIAKKSKKSLAILTVLTIFAALSTFVMGVDVETQRDDYTRYDDYTQFNPEVQQTDPSEQREIRSDENIIVPVIPEPEPDDDLDEDFQAGDSVDPDKIVDKEKDVSKQEERAYPSPIGDDWRVPAILIASAGAVGLFAASKIKKDSKDKANEQENSLSILKNSIGDSSEYLFEDYDQIQEAVDSIIPEGNGIWVPKDSRDEIISKINEISAVQYTYDDDGFMIKDKDAPIDDTKSIKASKLIDNVIHKANRTIIGIDDTFYRPNIKDEQIQANKLNGGISIGDDTTDSVVLVEKGNVEGINILHELGHVLEDFEDGVSAIELENEIRRELQMQEREYDFEDQRLFYNNLNAGEAFLEDLAQEIGASVEAFSKSDGFVVISPDMTAQGYFYVGDEYGTYIDPNTEKIVVGERNFRYQMDLDLSEDEVYLRKFVESTGRVIEWVEEENMAVITGSGERFEIYPNEGDYGSYINQNDRIVITQEEAMRFVGTNNFEPDAMPNQLEVNVVQTNTSDNMVNDLDNVSEGTDEILDTLDESLDESYEASEDYYETFDQYDQDDLYQDKLIREIKDTISRDLQAQDLEFEDVADEVIKEFRFRLNLDIQDGEVYLRNYIENLDGDIQWDETTNTASVNLDGSTYEIQLGEHGSKIVNDRMVLEQDILEDLLELEPNQIDQDVADDLDSEIDNDYENANNKVEKVSFEDADTNLDLEDFDELEFQEGDQEIEKADTSLEEYLTYSFTTVGAGGLLHKAKKDLVLGANTKKEANSVIGFLDGIKEAIIDLGFDPKDLLKEESLNNELSIAGRFLSKTAWIENSNERQVTLSIVGKELEEIELIEEDENVYKRAKKFAKAFTPFVLASSVVGGLGASLSTADTVLNKDIDINQKAHIMKKHTDILLTIQEYLRLYPTNLNEMVLNVKENNEEYMLYLWDWDVDIKVKKSILDPKQDAILYKFSLLE